MMGDEFLDVESFKLALEDEDIPSKDDEPIGNAWNEPPPKLRYIDRNWYLTDEPHISRWTAKCKTDKSVIWEELKAFWGIHVDRAVYFFAKMNYIRAIDELQLCRNQVLPMPREEGMKVLDFLSRALVHMRRYAEAINMLQELISKIDEEKKKEPGPYRLLGQCYMALQEYEMGLDAYKRSVHEGPQNVFSWFEMGKVCLLMSSPEQRFEVLGWLCMFRITCLIAPRNSRNTCRFSQCSYWKIRDEAVEELHKHCKQLFENGEDHIIRAINPLDVPFCTLYFGNLLQGKIALPGRVSEAERDEDVDQFVSPFKI